MREVNKNHAPSMHCNVGHSECNTFTDILLSHNDVIFRVKGKKFYISQTKVFFLIFGLGKHLMASSMRVCLRDLGSYHFYGSSDEG